MSEKRKKHVDIVEYAKRGMTESVYELITNLVDVDEKDESGWNAVQWAAQRNDIEMLKLLIEAGASIDVSTVYGWAQKNNSKEMMQIVEELKKS